MVVTNIRCVPHSVWWQKLFAAKISKINEENEGKQKSKKRTTQSHCLNKIVFFKQELQKKKTKENRLKTSTLFEDKNLFAVKTSKERIIVYIHLCFLYKSVLPKITRWFQRLQNYPLFLPPLYLPAKFFLVSILPSELELLRDSVADDKTLFPQISFLQKRKSEQICILQKSKSVTVSQFILVASKRFSEGMRNGQGGR